MAKEYARQFYQSKEWQNVRDYIYRRDNMICRFCGAPGEEVHHIQWINAENIYDPNITLNEDNLILLCKNCHFNVHRKAHAAAVARANKRRVRERVVTEEGYYFDDAGNYIKRKVYIVYGAPRSGKSTYVSEHKQDGDIVVDVDRIIEAIQGDNKRKKSQNLLYISLDIRDYIYTQIENNNKNLDAKNIWIIAGLPKKQERIELADRLKAELIFIDCKRTDAISRAVQNNLYDDELYAIDIVNEWFNLYQP